MVKKRSRRAAQTGRTSKTGKRPAKKLSTKRTSAKKPSAKRAPAKTKAAAKKHGVTKKRVVKRSSRSARTVATVATSARRKTSPGKRPAALGRPRIPGTAELDQMFLKDYEARQVFAFLGVQTVRELEAHPPHEIIERLTNPMVRTVERIRKALAINNRYLAGDQKFAVQFSKQIR